MSVGIGIPLAAFAVSVLASMPSPVGEVTKGDGVWTLCQALEAVRPGERLAIRVSGIYMVGPESQILYDPRELSCPTDIQSDTWVEFAKTAARPAEFNRILKADRRVQATFSGELYGPGRLGPDDPALPAQLALVNRVSGGRYGHLNWFRTKLVVDDIVSFAAAPASTPWESVAPISVNDLGSKLRHADMPLYPPLALHSGLTGTVIIDVTVDEGHVTRAEHRSGDRVLADSAIANVKTWQFESGTTAIFTTEFIYALERRSRSDPRHIRIDATLPTVVRIIAPRIDW